ALGLGSSPAGPRRSAATAECSTHSLLISHAPVEASCRLCLGGSMAHSPCLAARRDDSYHGLLLDLDNPLTHPREAIEHGRIVAWYVHIWLRGQSAHVFLHEQYC